jgi:UDP-glucose 4-epimerase
VRTDAIERAVVTGAAGFIGSHLAEALVARGCRVTGIDCFLDSYAPAIKRANLERLLASPAFTLVSGNLVELELEALLDGASVVFHCAARAGVRTSWGDDFRHYVRDNLLATQRILEAASAASLERFVYTSSSSIYGDAAELPVHETAMPAPISPYGVTKLGGEHLGRVYHTSHGVPFVALRLFTVYGPRQRPDMAFHRFFHAVRARRAIELYGDGTQTRDFTFVGDAVAAILAAATSPGVAGEAINVAGGSRVSLNEVIDAIGETAGIVPIVNRLAKGIGEAQDTFASITKAERLLGYAPRVSLREGLKKEHDWILAQGGTVRVEG